MKYAILVLSAFVLAGCAYQSHPVVSPPPSPFVIPGKRLVPNE